MAALIAACGSTAAIDQGAPIAVEDGSAATGNNGVTLPPEGAATTPGATATDGTATTSTPLAGGSPTAGSDATTSPKAGTGSTQPSQGNRPAATGRTGIGVTDDELVVGIAVADEVSPGNEELYGIEGVTTGDTDRYYEIMRDHINERGGVAGRDICYPVYRFSTADGAQASQLNKPHVSTGPRTIPTAHVHRGLRQPGDGFASSIVGPRVSSRAATTAWLAIAGPSPRATAAALSTPRPGARLPERGRQPACPANVNA